MSHDESNGANNRGEQWDDDSDERTSREARHQSHHEPRERTRITRRMFEPLVQSAPFGAASISLLLKLMVDRTRSHAWSVHRQRAHARALIALATDHYYSDEEMAILSAFLA